MTQIRIGKRIGRAGKIRLGCIALLFDNERERVLLARRADNGQWCLPSGGLEPGESVIEACQRETFEETGLQVRVKRLASVYSSPDRLVIYQDGTKAQIVGLAFEVEAVEGEPRLSNETTEISYYSRAEMENMDIFPHHKQFIEDALKGQHEAFIR